MKLAFSTLGCPDWSWDEIIVNAREIGFDGIEIRGIEGQMRPERMPQFMPGRQQSTLRDLERAHIKITDIGTSATFHDPQGFDAAVEEGCMAVDICARMGIPFIRVFGDRVPDLSREDETVKRVADGIRAVCTYAQGTGVGTLIEAHGEFNSAARLQKLIDTVGCDNFGVLWDIGNSDADCGDDFDRFYQPFKRYIRHVHVKDLKRSNREQVLMGQGDLPVAGIVRRLRDDDFQGYLALEWEKKWNPTLANPEEAFPQYIRYIREVLKK